MNITEKELDAIADKILEKLDEKTNKKDFYKETESMLRAYPNYKKIIEKNNERIQEILKNGIREQRKGTSYDIKIAGGTVEFKGIPEIEIEKIEHLKSENLKLEKRIIRVDNALLHIQEDPYYSIILLRYFKKISIGEIAEELNVSERTIGVNRTRLIRELSFILFSELNIDRVTL